MAPAKRKFFGVFRTNEEHIPIPTWFFQRFGDGLDDIVLLKDPVGNMFPVYICIRRGRAYFCLGVNKLRISYNIFSTFTIRFKYVTNWYFKIRVFGSDALEIDYPVVM
ncbi:DNA-binding barrel domain superfamily [Sesbania bispinosa]|nr:DNA-binding barrel domain superfamily [Sesbania bispinosa]